VRNVLVADKVLVEVASTKVPATVVTKQVGG